MVGTSILWLRKLFKAHFNKKRFKSTLESESSLEQY
jgi:hypothetical protein